MAIAFIKPNTKKEHYGKVVDLSAIEPPVWLILMSQAVEGGVVIDMEAEGMDEDALMVRLKMIGVTRAVVLATGSHPSAHIQQGEAAAALKARIAGEMQVEVDVYDHLPFSPTESGVIDWSRVRLETYRAHNWHAWGRPDRHYGATFASVSCPYKCDFCCVRDFYRSGYCQRKPGHILEDIRGCIERGVTNIKMMDELFAVNNPGVNAACERLAASGMADQLNIWAYARIDTVDAALLAKMRAAGVRWLAYGIESGSETVRAGVTKGRFTNQRIRDVVNMTRDAGIHVLGNFMFGFWEDDLSTMRATLDLAMDLRCAYVNFYCMSIYKGSDLYATMTARGVDLPVTGEEYAQMSPRFKPVPTKTLSGHQVLQFRDAAFKEYFSDAGYLSHMGKVFGAATVDEIRAMAAIDLRSGA